MLWHGTSGPLQGDRDRRLSTYCIILIYTANELLLQWLSTNSKHSWRAKLVNSVSHLCMPKLSADSAHFVLLTHRSIHVHVKLAVKLPSILSLNTILFNNN